MYQQNGRAVDPMELTPLELPAQLPGWPPAPIPGVPCPWVEPVPAWLWAALLGIACFGLGSAVGALAVRAGG